MPGRLKALILLGWSLVVTLLRRLFRRGRSGLEAFRENYHADGLSPVSEEQRRAMEGFAGCIACGLCDRGEGERIARSGGQYAGVMRIMTAASRSMPDFGAAAVAVSHVPEAVLAEKEAICPGEVPMVRIARFIRDKADQARPSSLGPPAVGASP